MITNQTYPTNLMITAEVQVNSWNSGDYARAGVGLYTNTSNGTGYNLVFHGTNQVQFLDDHVAWGNSYAFTWQVGTWYWFQLEENNGTLLGKVWAAGTAEPQSWVFQQTGWTDRTSGAPALNGSSASTTAGSATVSFASVSVTTTSVQPDTAAAGSAITTGAGSPVTFSNAAATGTGPLTYAWNFGDGTTASGTLNPTHTYQTAGTYTAQLTVTDALGIPAISTLTATVNGTGSASPTVSAGSPLTVNAGSSVTFSQATESGGTAPFTYSWNFGDGTAQSGSLNPSHTYANPGSYTTTLTVTDANNLSSSSTAAVTVNDVAPTVTLNDPASGTTGTALTFAASASDISPADQAAGFTYSWNFGDGGTATGASPSHTFASAGTYAVTVTATDQHGLSGTASGTISITGGSSPVLFQDTFSSSTPSSAWSFHGGTWQINNGTLCQTSTAAGDPQKAMITNQTYPANLMITAEVQVNSWNPGDYARAGVGLYTNTSNGNGYNLVFHGTNQVQFLDDHVAWGNSYAFTWQVGTWYWFQLEENNGTLLGKVWAAGTAEPQSWVFQQTGWTDRTSGAPALNGSSACATAGSATVSFASVSVTTTSVQPDTATAGSALNSTAGSPVTFSQAAATGTGALTYAWNFGDGNTATGTLNPTHTYQTTGTYSAQLTITDALGIPASSTLTVTVNSTSTSSSPAVSAGSPITVNAGSSVTFSQATESGGTAPFTYTWNFGDGTVQSGSLNPSHTYANPGSYAATLTVTDANNLSSSSSAAVTVNDVTPTVSLNDPTSGTVGTALSFAASASDISPADQAAGFTYSWNFGDGSSATGANPSHTFASAGAYAVTVTATDEYGLSGTASGTITITGSSSAVLFQDTFSSSTPSSAWSFLGGTWQINNGALSQTSTAPGDPQKAMITNQTYPTNLMITAEVQVNSWNSGDYARAGVGLYTNTSNGTGYNLVFHGTNQVQFLDDHVTWGNSYAFTWQVGTWYWFQLEENNGTLLGKVWAAGTAEPQSWMFQQTGWTDRTSGAPALNGSSASATAGSATVSFASVSVTTTSVQPDSATAGSAITTVAGTPVTFSQAAATGTGPVAYAWNFGDGNTATGTLNPTHTYQTAGTYTAQLTVTDALGIPATSTLTVTVNSTGTSSLAVSAGSPITVNAGSSVTFSQATETQGNSTGANGRLAVSQVGTVDFSSSDVQPVVSAAFAVSPANVSAGKWTVRRRPR